MPVDRPVIGNVVANESIEPAGSGGHDVFASNSADLVIDIDGDFAAPGESGLSLYSVEACRVFDSRLPAGAAAVTSWIDVNITASACGIPPSAEAFVLNVTAVPVGGLGFLSLWPQGQQLPVASTLNSAGAITSNMAIVPTTNGSISMFPSDPTHLILDVSAYFAQ
jgi:hypothetical protein